MDQEKGLLREKALRAAIDAINEAGGVGSGFRIDLMVKSSAGTSREISAATAAKEIVSSAPNLVGFITSFSSESKGVTEQVAIPGHYPVISGAATSGFLSGISQYFQRLCPPDVFESGIFIEKANLYGIKTAAIAVEEGDTYSEDLGRAFQQGFGSGTSVLVKFKHGDPEYPTKLNQLMAGNAEAIFISMLNPQTYTEFISHLDAMHSAGGLENTSFILCDALYTGDLLAAPVAFMTGEVNGHPRNFGAIPSADTASGPYLYFKSELYNRFQQQPASFNAQFYDMGFLYAMAIEKAFIQGGLNDLAAFRDNVNRWIRQISHGNPTDPIIMPSLGWIPIKYACQNGGVNYTGASGNCDIDDLGNTKTPFALFKIVLSGTTPKFEIISIIYPE
jgi:ABC-type branched-subunit amino acid transport system substrate-binding protein